MRSNPAFRTRGTKVPDRPEGIHEIKHDGYRQIIQRGGKRVRLAQRSDWIGRFPLITEAPHRNSSFVIDGEAALLGSTGDRTSTACIPAGHQAMRCNVPHGLCLVGQSQRGTSGFMWT